MIQIKNISKKFQTKNKENDALCDINLNINDGEIFGIIGLSGAGKTTLLRILSLLETPTNGEIFFNNHNLFSLSKKEIKLYRNDIGVVFQGYNLLMQKTVYKNIAFPLEIRHIDKNIIKDKVNKLLKIVGLDGYQDKYPKTLSGGEQQRVAIARSLSTNPKLLLLDEVTSALDPITTKQILKLLKDINQEFKTTMILITHQMGVVANICDHVVVLNYGRVEEEGRAKDLINNPKSSITRMLLGKENIL